MTKLIIRAAIRVLQECLAHSPYNLELIISKTSATINNLSNGSFFCEPTVIDILTSNIES